MAKLLRLRRGTTTQHSTFTGAEGEVTVDTTKDTLVVHDNATAGGRPMLREDVSNLAAGAITSTHIADGTIVNADINASAAIANSKLATSGVTAGTYGAATDIPVITVNDKGIVTSVSTATPDKISEGNTSVEVVDAGTGAIQFTVDGGTVSEITAAGGYRATASDVTRLSSNVMVSRLDGTGVTLGVYGGTSKSELRFLGNTVTDWVGFKAPASLSSAIIWTLPSTAGSAGQFLSTNGSNQLGWSTAITASDTGTVTSTMIADGTIVNADINASAAIAGTKISPDFGSQNITTTGSATCAGLTSNGNLTISSASPVLTLKDNDSTGNANVNYIVGKDSADNTKWYVGDTSGANSTLFIGSEAGDVRFDTGGYARCSVDSSGHFIPYANNAYDLGTSALRWRNLYTNDLNLSNEGSQNDVDGTWGSWTIQEGEDDLFLLNRRNGKKYKFNLQEVN